MASEAGYKAVTEEREEVKSLTKFCYIIDGWPLKDFYSNSSHKIFYTINSPYISIFF
jgi:hypothetical protein